MASRTRTCRSTTWWKPCNRRAAPNPLFQVMCNVQRWEFQQTRQLAGMTVEYIANDARATKFDLNLEVTDLDQRLGCCLTYSRDLFDEPRIARMAGLAEPAGGAAGRPAAAHCRAAVRRRGAEATAARRHGRRGRAPGHPPWPVRRPRGGQPGPGADLRRTDPELCRTRRPLQPSGARPAQSRRRPGSAGRPGPGVRWRWSSACWRSSRPAAPTCRWTGISAGAPAIHDRGQRRTPAAQPRGAVRGPRRAAGGRGALVPRRTARRWTPRTPRRWQR